MSIVSCSHETPKLTDAERSQKPDRDLGWRATWEERLNGVIGKRPGHECLSRRPNYYEIYLNKTAHNDSVSSYCLNMHRKL